MYAATKYKTQRIIDEMTRTEKILQANKLKTEENTKSTYVFK